MATQSRSPKKRDSVAIPTARVKFESAASRGDDSGIYVKGNSLERMTYKIDAKFVEDGRPFTIELPREQWLDAVEGIAEHLGEGWQERFPNCTFVDPDDSD
jgi:hypothetical protein